MIGLAVCQPLIAVRPFSDLGSRTFFANGMVALAVQLSHTVRVVTPVRAELLAVFHGAEAGRVRTLFGPVSLVSFSK